MPPIRGKLRRPYLLLEVIIALSLAALCAIPLLAPHYALVKREAALLEQVQLERVAEESLAEIKQRLYAHKIYWWDRRSDAERQVILDPVALPTLRGGRAIFERIATVTLTQDGQTTRGSSEQRLLQVSIELKRAGSSKTFTYLIYAERLRKENP